LLGRTVVNIFRSNEFLIFISTIIVYVLTVNTLWTGDHANSIMELEYAMFSSHTFALGKAVSSNSYILGSSGVHNLDSVDIFEYNHYFYSAIAPGFAFFALPFASLGFIMDGHFTFFGHAALYNELFSSFANSIAAVLVYKVCRLYFRESTSVFIAFAYAFSTISWPLATMIFQHDLSAMFDLISAYCILSYFRKVGLNEKQVPLEGVKKTIGILRPVLGGLAVGLAFTVDYINGAIIALILGFTAFCLWRTKSFNFAIKIRIFLSTLGAASIGVAVIFYYNIESFGHILDFSEQTYLASRGGLLASFSTPIYEGLEIMLLSPYRGLVLYCPIVVVGFLGLLKVLRNKPKNYDSSLRRDVLFLGLLSLGTLLPYSAWYDIYGGESFGPRFLVAAIPFILIPVGFIFESQVNQSSRTSVAFRVFLVYVLGTFINAAGAMNNALGCGKAVYANYVPFECSIPNLAEGKLDGWWRSLPAYYWGPIVLFVIAFTLILPVPWLRRIVENR
jgi:hypothetical protein